MATLRYFPALVHDTVRQQNLFYISFKLYSVFFILSVDNALSRVSIVLCVGEVS